MSSPCAERVHKRPSSHLVSTPSCAVDTGAGHCRISSGFAVSTQVAPDSEPTPAGIPTGEPQWLALDPEPVYAVLHTPPAARSAAAALILPAFGWDDECSYRRRRDWAVLLAEHGITAARFDLPGSEDSPGSPLAPGRVESWVAATAATAAWLRERSGCTRLAAIGIGLGGLLAYEAIMREAPVDDLLLWGVRASGRAFVRELRAYAALTERGDSPSPDGNRGNGALGIGGHVMSIETANAISEIDLTRRALPDARRRRVLLVGRDVHGVDAKLHAHLTESGAHVTTLESDEYRDLMSPPDLVLTPIKVIDASIDWLLAGEVESAAPPSEAGAAPSEGSARTLGAIDVDHQGVLIRERITQVQAAAGRLVGVISEPVTGQRAPYCLLTVNSGALRHTGPNRLFVEIARAAAARGIPAARFDLPGLGDSDGTAIRSFDRTAADDPQALATIQEICDHLRSAGVAERFVAGGFSLGGYLTIRATLAASPPQPPIGGSAPLIGAISINPTGFSWTVKQRQRAVRDFTALAGPDALAEEAQTRLRRAPMLRALERHAGRLRRAVDARARHALARSDALWRLEHRREIADLRRGLDLLRGSRVHLWLFLTEGEPLLRMLDQPKLRAELDNCPQVTVERLPGHDHLLRPLWIQEIVMERFISALEAFRAGDPAQIESLPKTGQEPSEI